MSTWTAVKGEQVTGAWHAPVREWHVGADQAGWIGTVRVPDTDEGRRTVARMVAALQMEEALEASPHRRGCRINPGGPIMAALGDPEQRPCSCGRDAALEAAKRLPETP